LPGQTAILAWTSQDAISCNIQPDIGPVELQGSVNITPKTDTDYALACTGPGGSAGGTVYVSIAKPRLSPVVINPEKEETVNLLIEFDFNKSVIKPEFYQNVNAVGEFMQKYPTASIRVEGYTDSVGGKVFNKKLSQRRAEAVKKYIVDKFGIDAKRIKAIGYGEAKPVASNKTAEGRYKNRRVQAYHTSAM
jgi:OOP family OmpA-OmpF porin